MRTRQQWIERAATLAAKVGKPVMLYQTKNGPALDVASPTLDPYVIVNPDGLHFNAKRKTHV